MDKNGWIRSDGMQIVRQVAPKVFELAEVQNITPDEYVVVRGEIALGEYSPDDILGYIQGYGYNSIKSIEEQYGNSANQIIAECIFESQQLSEYEFVSAPFPSEDEAEKLLREIESSK